MPAPCRIEIVLGPHSYERLKNQGSRKNFQQCKLHALPEVHKPITKAGITLFSGSDIGYAKYYISYLVHSITRNCEWSECFMFVFAPKVASHCYHPIPYARILLRSHWAFLRCFKSVLLRSHVEFCYFFRNVRP